MRHQDLPFVFLAVRIEKVLKYLVVDALDTFDSRNHDEILRNASAPLTFWLGNGEEDRSQIDAATDWTGRFCDPVLLRVVVVTVQDIHGLPLHPRYALDAEFLPASTKGTAVAVVFGGVATMALVRLLVLSPVALEVRQFIRQTSKMLGET